MGETPIEGARRELLEETGLTVGQLNLYAHGVCEAQAGFDEIEYWTFYGPCWARDEEVQCFEGQAMLYVPPRQIPRLEFGSIASLVVPSFVKSPEYYLMDHYKGTR